MVAPDLVLKGNNNLKKEKGQINCHPYKRPLMKYVLQCFRTDQAHRKRLQLKD